MEPSFAKATEDEALVVELVDTQDLKSCGQQWPYRFNSDPGHFLEATLSRVAFFVLCICTYRKSGVGSRELVACLPAGRSTAPPKKDMRDPCKSVLSVALYLFVPFVHFVAQKSLEEAYFPPKSISCHTKSFSALVFFTF